MTFTKKLALGAALAALASAPLALAAGKSIQVKGSDTMVNLGTAWAEAFMKRKPGVEIAVTGGGSGTGIAALINGTCDVAECSRAMKDKEKRLVAAKGAPAKEITVAIDALVVAVNPANPVDKLDFGQLSDIFTGKKTSWKDFGGPDRPITVLSRERNSGTHVYFLEHVLRHGNEKGPEEYAKTALMMPSSQAIVDEVAQNKDAIGYYGLGYLNEKNKALAVAHQAGGEYVKPSAPDATAGRYPISRPLFLYTRGEPTGEVKEFVDFCLSPDGQEVVEKLDFVKIPAAGKK
ncbi:MAG TPA: phosphate ABC transporter substrate-binding protein [Planctomycetota bacterium]|nr:phosphate ABC transporter substrate-binding protein [Planctomycetota bacterium]